MSALNLAAARKIIRATEEKAQSLGVALNIAVVDGGGNLLAHVRMDNSRLGAIDIAINKAWTARAFELETEDLARYSQPGQPFYGIHASNGGKVMLLAGGIPLRDGAAIVGAVGVSGGSAEDDVACARAGAAAFP